MNQPGANQSAQGEAEQFGDPLSTAELEKLGQGKLARMVAAARARGVDAWGWLPSDAGVDEMIGYAKAHGAEVVLLPSEPEEPGLLDRLRGRRVVAAVLDLGRGLRRGVPAGGGRAGSPARGPRHPGARR